MSFPNPYYPVYTPGMGSRPRLQSMHPFRQMMAAGTNMNGAWSAGGGSGHSGYGPEPQDYDYHSGPPAQVPSGGSYSYHAATGTGYGGQPPPHPAVHPQAHAPAHHPAPPPASSGGGKMKGGGGKQGWGGSSSTMSALTLLSFLFFVNLLQGCIKDHMDYMNPTVMVMTPDIRQNRFNKMGEMNSREQSAGASSSASFSSNAASGANIVMQPADMVAAAAMNAAAVMEAMKPMANLQSPYSGINGIVNKPAEMTPAPPPQQPPLVPAVTHYQSHNPEPEVHYQRPYYDPHQPDVYEHHHQHPPATPPPPAAPQYYPQQPPNYQPPAPNYVNQSTLQQPAIYMGTPMDQHQYNYPNNEYHHPQPAPVSPHLYTTPRNPFYEHQHPPAYSHKGDQGPPQYLGDNEHKYPQNYPASSQEQAHNSQGPVPWSSHSSSSSSSVVSGPFRRATIVSVSPTIKWVSVPSNVDDHTDFDTEEVAATNRNNRYSESAYYGKFQ